MKSRIFLAMILITVVIISLHSNVFCQTWDYNSQFESGYDTSTNPNSVWSYGYYSSTGLGSNFILYNTPVAPYWQKAWCENSDPNIKGYLTLNMMPGSENLILDWGEGMSLTPYMTGLISMNSLYPASRFTAPEIANYQIQAEFENRVYGLSSNGYASRGLPVNVYVLVNGVIVSEAVVQGFEDNPANNIFTYSEVIPLTAGATVDFAARCTDSQIGALVRLDVTVTSQPYTEPNEEPECVLWLKADPNNIWDEQEMPATLGSVVGRWEDLSGNNLDALLQFGDPTLELSNFPNGDYPVVHFDGDDGLQLNLDNAPDALKLSTFSIYLIGRMDFDNQFSESQLASFTTSNGDIVYSSALIPHRYYLLACICNELGEKKLYLNGELISSGIGAQSYNESINAQIGFSENDEQFLTGDIAEIKIYNGFQSIRHEQIQTSLLDQYGLGYVCEDQGIYLLADVDHDCYISLSDFSILANNWLNCNNPQDSSCTGNGSF